MPLINLTTNLKTLKFGQPLTGDRPGGGYSGLPYIVTPIEDTITLSTDPTDVLFRNFYTANKNTLDFPIRGGNIANDGPGGMPTSYASRIDAIRIRAFMEDRVRGALFLLKQRGLQLSNPNIQVPSITNQVGFDPEREILPITRTYNETGASTIAQVLSQGTGVHLPRHGLSTQYNIPFQQTYEYYVTKNNTTTTNRLSVLHQTKVAINNPFLVSRAGDDAQAAQIDAQRINTVALLNSSNKYSVSPLGSQIFNYQGGPGSALGDGYTIIKRVVDTTQAAQKAATLYNAFTLTYQQLLNQDTAGVANPSARQKIGAKIQDFRAQLNTRTAQPGNYLEVDYSDTKKWYNPGLRGDPGALEKQSRTNYSASNASKVDKVTGTNLFYYDASQKTPWNAIGVDSQDIIKFAFECLDNDNPNQAIAIVFRAFLSSFTDNHQAEFGSFKYLGRGETFRTYQGADRSISFSFKIAAQSRDEMRPMYAKLNHLISQIYPDYSATSKLMRGSVIKLTIGDYLYRVPGFLESVNLSVINDGAWEIALDPTGLDQDMNQMPQMVEVQCSFKPIHNFLPRRETKSDSFVPFIGSVTEPAPQEAGTTAATPTSNFTGWLDYSGKVTEGTTAAPSTPSQQ